MHHYSTQVYVKNLSHHTLQQCSLPCCIRFYDCLGDCCVKVQQRYLICVLTAIGLTITYLQRMCLSIMITQMVLTTKEHKVGDYCPSHDTDKGSSSSIEGQERFDWSVEIQGYIIASFFWGYFITHIPGGIISDLLGGKHIFGVVVLGSSLCSALTPFAAKGGYIILLILRFIMGLMQGPIFPVITSLVAQWAPPDERAFMYTICNSGVPLGLVLGNVASGALLKWLENWQIPFYIYGVIGGVWFIFWQVIAAPSPASHPFITNTEADFIKHSILAMSSTTHGRIPWKSIFLDKSFLTATLANLGHESGLFFIAQELPIYMSRVLRMDVNMNGILSAIPWVAMWVGNIIFGQLSITFLRKKVLSTISVRRIFGGMCNLIPGTVWASVVWLGCDYVLVDVVISVGCFFVGAVFASIRTTFLDISPNFAGISMSIAAAVAGIAGFAVPQLVHFLIKDGTAVSDWESSFYGVCGFVVISTIPYLLLVSADTQPWNEGLPPKSNQPKASLPPRSPKSK